ncbi:MAG: response regulator [Candidatus Latescibacteria bacterium]|jgi:CheY-like chemotaxis protein|nr:response regulator [Candidatus Latescibacterota bacterium]MDP7448813.1 response regulator [Candidatus Latescibacterota bacterium]HJP29890.1 response regulator [Candidatus Latescibacterota bacterium]
MASILVVDDSEMVQRAVSAVLSRKGHEVVIAGKAVDGVQRVKERAFDLILMDLNLPDSRGERAIRALRLVMKVAAPILVISTEIKVDTVLELRSLGVVGFVDKTEGFGDRLVEEVDKALAGGDPR